VLLHIIEDQEQTLNSPATPPFSNRQGIVIKGP
jgi:hypothetical protein